MGSVDRVQIQMAILKPFQAMTDRKSYVKPEQVEALINYFFTKEPRSQYESNRNVRKGMLVFVLWRTGRRISEIVGFPYDQKHNRVRCAGLRKMDFDFEEGIVSFHILKKLPVKEKNKTGAKRSEDTLKKMRWQKPAYIEQIAMDEGFMATMKDYIDTLGIRDHERVFPYDRKYCVEFIRKACEKLDLNLGYKKIIDPDTGEATNLKRRVTPHAFRHGFSLNFLKKEKTNPAALPMLQELLCHSSIVVTKTYLRFDQEDRRKALNRVFKEENAGE